MMTKTNKMFVLLVGIVMFWCNLSEAQQLWVSPCPRLFSYEPQKENDRWFGVVTLTSDTDLKGVWLRVAFDRPSLELGNWFGEIRTSDNTEYLIHNRNHELTANMPYALRFYIKYDPNNPPPQLTSIRLNARLICPEGQTTTPAAITGGNQLITSAPVTNLQESPNKQLETIQTIQTIQEDKQDTIATSDDVQCGVPVKRVVPLISHGTSAIEGAWPWHVAIYTLIMLELKYICGGSLLTKTHILTAAHCVARQRTSQPADPARFLIHLGQTQLNHFNKGLQQRQITNIILHPLYQDTTNRNDLAILTLSQPVEYTEYVRPICLTTDTYATNLTHQLGTVVGWGYDHNFLISETLQETEMPVVDLLTCVYSEPEVYGKFTTTNNFCAGFKNGTSVCNGDSGGGMFFEREVDSSLRWELRGMVSFSVASRHDVCNPNAYAVFTDVLKYKPWIEQQIQ